MSSLIEQYQKITDKVSKINEQIHAIEENLVSLEDRSEHGLPIRIDNLNKQIEKIDDYLLRIQGFKKLASDNLDSKNLLTIDDAPEEYRVDLNRLRRWAMMIDPTHKNDPYAQRVYAVTSYDEKFLEKKKREFSARVEELRLLEANGISEEYDSLTRQLEEKRNELCSSELDMEIIALANNVVKENESHWHKSSPKNLRLRKNDAECIIPGAYGVPLELGDNYKVRLKEIMGVYYDSNGERIYLPFKNIRLDKEFAIAISCIPATSRINELDAGIRNFILDVINNSTVGSRKVYIVDAMRQNSTLVGTLKQLEETYALAHIPRNEEQISATLEELISSFADIDELIENYDTVAEYNSSPGRKKDIQRKIVILVGWPQCFAKENAEHIKRIVNNYERYGISFVMVSITNKESKNSKESANEEFGFSDYILENSIHINMTRKETTISYDGTKKYKFAWYTFKDNLSETFIQDVHNNTKAEERIGNEYTSRYDMVSYPEYVKSYQKIELPFGIDAKDEVHSISFENENFATYLMGASRSGKSTLIHTLIAGIISKYHPDNVELWLADFKQTEFRYYIENRPPHVKYVLLDESPELVYDLVDKLTEKMLERQLLFKSLWSVSKNKMGVDKITDVDYSKLTSPLPVIFVILDEFSIMSQAIQESAQYKLKLQNLLAKGAALGFKFLFASQTYVNGISGLTSTAKEQIQQRIAMKASYTEIKETLELSTSLMTDKVKLWMEALPPHYALIKRRIHQDALPEVKRLWVLYFKNEDIRKNFIDLLNEKQQCIEEYRPGDIGVYVDKNPVLVDGASFEAFNEKAVLEYTRQLLQDKSKYSGDEVFISLGRPRLMDNMRGVALSPESRQNILFVADSSDSNACASIITSVIKSFIVQEKKVEIWAYERNRIYRSFKNALWSEYDILSKPEEIRNRIIELKEYVQGKDDETERIIILIGLENLVSELEYVQDKNENIPKMESANKQPVIQVEENNEEIARRKAFEDFRRRQGGAETLQKEEDKELRDLKAQVAIQMTQINKTNELNSTQSISNGTSFVSKNNIMSDLQYVVQQGGRRGIHFMLVLNAYGDLKQVGLNQDLFRHRVALQMPAEDSRTMFSSKVASELPEHVGIYSDMLERFSFRPYLHRGLSLDGCEISDDKVKRDK